MRLVEDIPMYAAGGPVCYLCGDDDHPGEPVLDTEHVIEMEGVLHICARCIADAAALYGFATPETVAKLKDRTTRLQAKVAALESERDAQRARLEAALA